VGTLLVWQDISLYLFESHHNAAASFGLLLFATAMYILYHLPSAVCTVSGYVHTSLIVVARVVMDTLSLC
jgi:hypothetical protein